MRRFIILWLTLIFVANGDNENIEKSEIRSSYHINAQFRPPLSTKGSKIIDANAKEVKLNCVNWYGAHMERYVVDGLDEVPLDVICKNISSLGFNCVRLVYSNELFFKNPVVKQNAIKANTDLHGLTGMQIFDLTVESLTKHGVMVILNNHISDAKWCCSEDDGNGLWYNPRYSEEMWLDNLKNFTLRYKNNAMVIGNDLRNELRRDNKLKLTPDWGSGNNKTDWKIAATKGGNLVLENNPNLLIFIEGLDYANDLRQVRNSFIKLNVDNKLVYSFHVYSWDGGVSNFKSYAQTKKDLDGRFGYILQSGHDYTAPLWLGEFGTNSKIDYWKYVLQYIAENKIGWAYWAYNGYQHTPKEDESFGIVDKSFRHIRDQWKINDLINIMREADIF